MFARTNEITAPCGGQQAPVFQHARLQPLADQAHEPPVRDPVFREPDSHSQLTESKNARMSASSIQFTFFR